MTTTSSLLLVITSFNDDTTAAHAVRSLVKEKLAACGTLIPKARSIYSWQEKVEETNEVVVWIKTDSFCSELCVQRLRELHPYEVPEIIVLKPESVGTAYATWVDEVLGCARSPFS